MPREQITGRPVRELIGDEAFIRAEPFIKRAVSGERVSCENMIAVQGTYHWYKIDYMPGSDESGTVKNIIALMLDITEQKNKDEILQESENRFRMLFDQSPDVNLLVTKDGIIADINEACLEVTGYRRDEVIGQKYIKMPWTIRKTIPQLMSIYNEAMNGRVIREQELVLQHKNGTNIYFELFVNPITVDGEVKIFQTILRNITKRKQAEEELGLSEEKFRFIVENSMMPMIIATLKDYTVIFYNSYATDFFIDTSVAGTIKANNYWVHPEERDGFIAILKEKGYVHSYEAELKTSFGEHKWCLLSAKIINYLGQPSSFVMVNDITELKHAQEEREKLLKEIKEALSRVKLLSGMLPICASCKKIRNDKGYWEQIESYIRDHSDAEFSHGICPDCAKKLYPGIYKGE
jgi:PAS domain S-box-containing protein